MLEPQQIIKRDPTPRASKEIKTSINNIDKNKSKEHRKYIPYDSFHLSSLVKV